MKLFLFISSLALCLCLSACGKKSPPPTVQAVPMQQTQTSSGKAVDSKATAAPATTQPSATPVSNQTPVATVKTAAQQPKTTAPSTPPVLNPKTETKGKISLSKDINSVADAATGLSSLQVKANATKKIQDIQSKQNDKINSALKD